MGTEVLQQGFEYRRYGASHARGGVNDGGV
jgi:hypothetical protein